jgi:hypothetical protein
MARSGNPACNGTKSNTKQKDTQIVVDCCWVFRDGVTCLSSSKGEGVLRPIGDPRLIGGDATLPDPTRGKWRP